MEARWRQTRPPLPTGWTDRHPRLAKGNSPSQAKTMTDHCALCSEPCRLIIGSRGSQLALWQANHIADRLRARGHEVAIEIIRTTGDAMQHLTFAQVGATVPKGMFTKEIEEALYDKRIDLA